MSEMAFTIAGLVLFLMLTGMPVAFAMLFSGALGLYLTVGFAPLVGVIQSTPYETVSGYTLSTVPMFILLGYLLTASGMSRDLFEASHRWFGHIRGGLAYAAVGGGVMLAAISGSTAAAAATLAGAAYPEMRRYGYDDSFSTGVLAIVGTLAIMIPPSLAFVFYGIYTETPIGKLFMAGVIPGVLTAVGYVILINVIMRRNQAVAPDPEPRLPIVTRIKALKLVWPFLLLVALMLGGIYSGIVTPTEAGGAGAFVTLIIGVAMRRLSRKSLVAALSATVRTSGMIMAILGCAAVFSVFLSITGATYQLLSYIQSSGLSPYTVLISVVALLILLGCFIDQLSVLVITIPLVFPLLTGLGFDPIWLGVIYVKAAEIGFVTPPMGLNCFVVSGATGVPVKTVFRGIWPFVAFEFMLLAILIAFPQLSLWMPNSM